MKSRVQRVTDITLSIFLGVSCLFATILWIVISWLYLGLMSWGDGAQGAGPDQMRVYLSCAIYLLILAISCLPLFRRWVFVTIGVIAHGILVWRILVLSRMESATWVVIISIVLPCVFLASVWCLLCWARFRQRKPHTCGD